MSLLIGCGQSLASTTKNRRVLKKEETMSRENKI